jgi:hypothetical protein
VKQLDYINIHRTYTTQHAWDEERTCSGAAVFEPAGVIFYLMEHVSQGGHVRGKKNRSSDAPVGTDSCVTSSDVPEVPSGLYLVLISMIIDKRVDGF